MIFAVNHPTAFLDPIAVASLSKPTVHFMLRGDIFTTPLFRWLLNQIKTIPIFRFRDGYSNLKNNQDTFETVYQKLYRGDNILILAEGQTTHEKKMRPIQKGTARMVFGAYEKYNDLDLIVIPVGVNYSNSDEFRSLVMVDFGKAIPLSKYKEMHAENPRKAVKQMTDEISTAMFARIIHIDSEEDAEFTERLLEMNRHNVHQPVLPIVDRQDRSLLETEKHISNTINAMEEGPKSELKRSVEAYYKKLETAGIKDIALAQPNRFSWRNTLILIIGFIPFILGHLANYLPFRLSKYIADKKVKKIEFHSSIRFGSGMFAYLFYLIFLLIIAAIYFGWSGVIFILSLPLFGYFSLVYKDFHYLWNSARALKDQSATQIESLQKERASLLGQVLNKLKMSDTIK